MLDDYEDDEYSLDDESETLPCPQCGAEVYEDAEQCPACGTYVTFSSHPLKGRSLAWIVLESWASSPSSGCQSSLIPNAGHLSERRARAGRDNRKTRLQPPCQSAEEAAAASMLDALYASSPPV